MPLAQPQEFEQATGSGVEGDLAFDMANAYAERWVRTVRAECLDWLLIVGRGHLEQVLWVYVAHNNRHRPHRALRLEAPDPATRPTIVGGGSKAAYVDVTCWAVCSTNTDELHERLLRTHTPLERDLASCSRDRHQHRSHAQCLLAGSTPVLGVGGSRRPRRHGC
jgi:Integrase core domain